MNIGKMNGLLVTDLHQKKEKVKIQRSPKINKQSTI